MSFSKSSIDKGERGFTVVDNIFLTQYMPDSPPRCAEVYLFGLAMQSGTEADNTLAYICRALSLSEGDIMSAFEYWQELGLVYVKSASNEPFEVVYLPIMSGNEQLYKKFRPDKYSAFCKQIQIEISGREIGVSEFNQYFNFLERTNFQREALCAVARYAVKRKGASVNAAYILAIANNLSRAGISTLETVEQKLTFNADSGSDIALVFKNLGISRSADYSDVEMLENWTRGMGFEPSVIIKLAKNCKRGGMARLDALLKKYYRAQIFSLREIELYETERERNLNLAKEICRRLGVYYENLDPVVDEYIVGWLAQGFEEDAAVALAAFCFKTGVRTLEGMNTALQRLARLGVCTATALERYIEEAAAFDGRVRSLLDTLGIDRRVTGADRRALRKWTEDWGMDLELIMQAAAESSLAANPLGYLNKVLANMHESGAKSLSQAAAGASAGGAAATKTKPQMPKKPASKTQPQDYFRQRNYSDEQLRSLFANLDDVETGK